MKPCFLRLAGILALVLVAPGTVWPAPFDWPQWRGPDRTDVSRESGLLKPWPRSGPKQSWLFRNAGSGYSSFAVAQGKLFTLGTRGQSEILLALDANTGAELWTASVGPVLNNGYGDGPRGTPAVEGDHVWAMGGQGNLICASVADGRKKWEKSMVSLGGRQPNWGYAESVLVDGGRVICTPGGRQGTLAALDKLTGEVVWQSKEFTDDAHYASVVPAVLAGRRQYVQLTEDHVAGISAEDGKLLWQTSFPGRTAVIPTPIVHEGHVYATAGYGAGCKLVRIDPSGASVVYENRLMKNHHGGVILVGGHLYGYSDGVGWLCQDWKTGEEIWSERRALGKGAIACADGMLYCLDERSGTLVLVEASPKGWKEHGRFTLEPQSSIRSSRGGIWTHPVIANGKLYLRDQDLIYCYELKQG